LASYTYNSSNQLTSSADGYSYSYDFNGNTLSTVNSSGTTQYAWDFENRLTSVTLPSGGGVVSFRYDPLGRRIQKSGLSGATNYLYDGSSSIEELDASGGVLARYVQGGSIDEPLSMQRAGANSFFSADGLGSITSLTNAAGLIAETYSLDSFGKQTASTGSLSNPFQYTGREFDSETGLYYYRARYYDLSTGRFLSEDPLKFYGGSPNFYSYVGSSPVNSVDPAGKSKEDVDALISNAHDLTQLMLDAGLKFSGSGIANNALATTQYVYDALSLDVGLPFQPPYLGCGDQASFVIEGLIPLIPKLDDTWMLDQPGGWGLDGHLLYHQWVSATSSSPRDPDIIIDPWNNQYQLIPKGGKPNSANWQVLVSGGKP
jgi:RHS repeat-associated protein